MAGRRELIPGLTAIRTPSSDGQHYTYSLENHLPVPYTVSIDISQSKNVSFSGGLKTAQAVIPSQQTGIVGVVSIIDTTVDWSLKASYSWHEATTPAAPAKPSSAAPTGAKLAPAPAAPAPSTPAARPAPAAAVTSPSQNANIVTRDLVADVQLVRAQYPDRMEYTVNNNRATRVSIDIDITGSNNVRFENGTLKASAVVPGKKSAVIGIARPIDPLTGWSLSAKYACKDVADSNELATIKAQELAAAQAALKTYLDAKTPLWDDMSIYELSRTCAKKGVAFVDRSFPTTDKSVGVLDGVPVESVSWRRANQFLKNPKLFVASETGKKIEPNDISQGTLGDCWLMCALSALAEFEGEIEAVFTLPGESSPYEYDEAGVCAVKLCKNGIWRYVRVDDYFPCKPGGAPIFSKSHNDEMWVLLIEKAFAKVSGSYAALRGGYAYEALIDLTGCPTTRHDVHELSLDALWDLLSEHNEKDNVLSCSVPGEDKWSQTSGVPLGGPGLVSGHAYTLIDAKLLSNGTRLLLLRNPWGRFEWKGAWGDNSELWTPALKKEVNFVNADDGAFYMCVEDFVKFFSWFNICRLYSAPKQRWLEYRQSSYFKYGGQGEVSTPFMYELVVESDNKAWISLHQEDERAEQAASHVDLSIVVLRRETSGVYTLHACDSGSNERQQQLYAKGLKPGTYVVVAMTTGIRHTDVAPPSGWVPLKDSNGLTAVAREAAHKVFNFFDLDLDRSFGRSDFTFWYQQSHGTDMPPEFYAQKMGASPKGFRVQELIQYYESLPEATLREHFTRLGFNSALVPSNLHPFVLSVHAKDALTVTGIPYDNNIAAQAISFWLQQGTRTEYSDGKLTVFEVERGTAGVTLGLRSLFPSPLLVTIDCSESENVLSHLGALRTQVRLAPRQCAIAHHLAPIKPEERWSWTFSMNAKSAPN
eukprot:m.10827 g.10827  ORF g.10827 m.10827 type:complete len:930 (-) comp2562_c0_seq1:53-2842(-)